MKICPICSELQPDDVSQCPADGATLEKSTDPFVGRTIAARYRLLKRLGAGGMANVYLARHVIIERLGAIKILRPDLALNPTNRERFLREARAVNRINHPNIVEITDYGEVEGFAYLVMEYVEGESLQQHLRSGLLAWPRAAHLAAQIASALGRAHQMSVIHRDLKPENVLLVGPPGTRDESVKLTDFGIAKITDAPRLTLNQQVFGTPGYIAPEYVEGAPADGRADLYALGIVLYEMVTGHLPYEARTQADRLLKPLSTPPIPPSKRVAGLPPELESLLLKLLARRPDDRPRDAFAVIDVLHDVLRRFANPSLKPPPIASPEPLLSQIPRARGSNPTLDQPAMAAAVAQSPQARHTESAQRIPTAEIATRWTSALADLERTIERRTQERGASPQTARASVLAGQVRDMIPRVERAQRVVAESQARVDRIEAEGREFRANLGHAIDVLVHDRSRERAHIEALLQRSGEASAARTSKLPESRVELGVWEAAAVEAELQRASELDADLTFQIEALSKQLDAKNVELERAMLEGAGLLEGSLAALRQLTNELVRTLDEATVLASGGSQASLAPPRGS